VASIEGPSARAGASEKPTFPKGKLSGFNSADVQKTEGAGSVLRLPFFSQGSDAHAEYRMKYPICICCKWGISKFTPKQFIVEPKNVSENSFLNGNALARAWAH
jgi:hypothetical protein